MYDKLKKFFTENILWKILSIIMATLLWFVVMNINNPTEIKTFYLPINTSNLEQLYDNNKAVLNLEEVKQRKVEIKLKATRPVLDEVTKMLSKSEVKAYLDINSILNSGEILNPLEVTVQIKTTLSNIPYPNNNFEIVSFYPTTTTLNLDTIVTVPKKINVTTKGEVKAGYIASTPELSSEYIQVTGAKSIIENIDNVSIEIDITNQDKTFSKIVEPIAYDKEGNIIKDIHFNLTEISVKVNISSQGKLKINEPILTGNLPLGYSIKNISYTPKSINVIGSENSLKNTTYINIPPINISSLTDSKEFKFTINDILKPLNLSLEDDTNSEIKVFIEIEKIVDKIITLNSSQINLLGVDDKFIDIPEVVNIKISGSETNINNLDINEISASIDLNNLENGNHNIQMQVSLPKDIILKEIPFINVNISEDKIDISSESTTIENITTTSEQDTINESSSESIQSVNEENSYENNLNNEINETTNE